LTNPLNYAQLYTEKQAAELLSISIKNLYLLRKDGKIHYHQLGINIRYSLGDILEYEERCRK
jgi:predicted site-specific integrase-resolvase